MVGHLNWLSYLLMNTAISGELIYNPDFLFKGIHSLSQQNKKYFKFYHVY